MAFMHPEDIENYKHTGSELKMYYALKDQLPEKDHVFFSVRWFDQVDGKRIDSECDFLVFDPGFGFLTIECKGGTDINIENNIWTLTERDEEGNISKRELKKSPFAQAENSMRYFYDYFSKEFLQTFNGVYGFAVAFPNYSIDQKIECAAEENLIIDLRHMNQLSHRINEIFHYWRVRNNNRVPFSADQKSRFIKLVNKRISLSAAAGALIPIKEKEFEKINLIQDSIIDFLTNYKQVQIVGGAGTGKTYIAMKKCSRLLNSELDVLYVCKSVELAKFVKSNIVDNRFSSRSFDDLMLDITGRDDLSDIESYFDEVDRNTKKKYDAVVVDEAQDFTLDEAMAIRLLLKDDVESVLYVFMDKNQNLFDVKYESAFGVDEKPYVLRYNIRNTGEIYKYAIQNTGLGRETIANQLLGVSPEVKKYKSNIQALTIVSQILNRLIEKEFVASESIVIVSDVEYDHSPLCNDEKIGEYNICTSERKNKNSILFKPVNEYKGLESDIVIYLKNRIDTDLEGSIRNRQDYVAYTRARYYLYIVERE